MKTTTLLQLIENFDFKGVSFVSIREYCSDVSKNTEIADVLINVGESYENKKKADLKILQSANANDLVNENFGLALIERGIAERIESIVNPNQKRSQAQKDAYISLNEHHTIRYCKETKNVLIFATLVRKTVIKESEKTPSKSNEMTLVKKYIGKALNLRTDKVRQYKLSNINATVKVNGDTLEIE